MQIETQRLVIREYQSDDINFATNYLMDPEVMSYIPETFETIKDVASFIETAQGKYFIVIVKDTMEGVGHIYFVPFFGNHSYEIGWVFDKSFHSQGYAYEAAHAIMSEGFMNLGVHRVIATAQPENSASWKLMEKLGMRLEGYFKQCIPVGDAWWDEYYYAVLAKEWSNGKVEKTTNV